MQEHVLFLCPMAALVWRLAGIHNFFLRVVDHVDSFMVLIRPPSAHSSTILLEYIAYHIWFSRNAIMFNSSRPSARGVLERACALAREFSSLTLLISDT